MILDKNKETYEIIRFKLASFDAQSLDDTTKSLFNLFTKYNLKIIGPVFLPNKKFTIVLFKPVFVHKKNSKEAFQQVVHYRIIDVKFYTFSTKVSLATICQYFSLRPEIEITPIRISGSKKR